MITTKETPNSEEEIRKILNPVVEKWFFSRFKEFSLPQKFGVMEIHNRQNILVSAPTGATKTLTAFLSILNELVDSAQKGILEDKVYCVYISPLKALSNDISVNLIEPLKEMEAIAGKEFGIRVGLRTGDTTTKERSEMLKKPPHILITTPESLAILLSSPKFIEYLKNVDWCIQDEIHAIAENKRGVHLSLSIEKLDRLCPHMTRVGLSATISPLEEVAKYLAGYKIDEKGKQKLRNCQIVDVQFIKQLDLKVLSPVDNLIGTPHHIMHHEMYKLMDKLIQEHKTTLIFTNTRAATERVVDHLKEKFPKNYTGIITDEEGEKSGGNIGAHHGSLSKELRHSIESRLRKGNLKVIVSSTSLELGIDIGSIDLVICLGSPKSVARFLQRAGRAGHRLHETVKARMIVLDRDDLVECSVLLKAAVEKKIDRIHIPTNALDVLAQQIDGLIISERMHIDEVFSLVRQSYCYRDLQRKEFNEIIDYLTGKHVSLEDRYIYAKIWHDEETGMLGRKGKMGRVIYMTNIGTIPEESYITVKVGSQTIGKLDEAFLEKMRPGDVFVLGGEKYKFLYSRGMVAQVSSSVQRPPTIPMWVSESLPLSFDLAIEIGKFRRLMEEKFRAKKSKEEIIKFINEYLYVDDKAANAIHEYFYEQFYYLEIPHDKKILIETYDDEHGTTYFIFHALFGRRVNDALSRAVAFAISRMQHSDVEIGINDNGFYIASQKRVNAIKAFDIIRSEKLRKILEVAIDKTEILKRRFRHCAARSLMILRNYKGRTKRVGRQQVSSMILMNAVKRISNDFPILKEARREVLEDLMDVASAELVISQIESGKIKVKQVNTRMPSPFAFNLIIQGYADLFKIEDKIDFLRRMHENIVVSLSLKDKDFAKNYEYKKKLAQKMEFDYNDYWKELEKKRISEKDEKKENLKAMAWNLDRVPMFVKEDVVDFIDSDKKAELSERTLKGIEEYKKEILKSWPKELLEYLEIKKEKKK